MCIVDSVEMKGVFGNLGNVSLVSCGTLTNVYNTSPLLCVTTHYSQPISLDNFAWRIEERPTT